MSTTSASAYAKGVGIYVEGPQAVHMREALVDAVPHGLSVADAQAFSHALAAQGQRKAFGKALDGDGERHEASIKRVHDAALAMDLTAVLLARVTMEKEKWRVRLWVVESSGDEKGPEDVMLDTDGDPRRDSELKSTVEEMLVPYKETASDTTEGTKPSSPVAPIEMAPLTSSPPAGEDGTTPKRVRGLMTRSLLEVEVGGDAAGRHFDYNDGVTSNLRSYNVLPAALASTSVELFPLAEEKGVLRDIGFIGSYSRSLFLGSSAAPGVSIHTVESSISGGVRARLHPWGDTGTIIGVSDAYTSQAVTFDPAGGPIDSQVPAVNYQANRTGVDTRIPLGRFALIAGAGFRAVFNAGDVAERFRISSVDGVDGELGVAMTVVPGWEARLLGDYERYFYSFKPIPGDTYVAGGALDQFFGGTLALAYIF